MLAITGGVAEGKSTVLGYLADIGYKVASADALARDVFASRDVQAWVEGKLGTTEPVAVREAVSHDDDFRRGLNALTHPRILDAIFACGADAVEVPLLIETCLHPRFERVWVITCGEEAQLARLSDRVGADQAYALIAAQLPTGAKIPFADTVVRTNFPEESVRAYVIEAAARQLG